MPDYRISGEGPYTLRVLDRNGNETFKHNYATRQAAEKKRDEMAAEEAAQVVGRHPDGRAILADEGADGNVNKVITESEKAALQEQIAQTDPVEKLVRTAKVVPDEGPKTRKRSSRKK